MATEAAAVGEGWVEVATEVMKEVAERVVAVEARVAGSAEVVRAAAKVEVAR